MSCGFKAFQRDCRELLNGGWELRHAEGHILFPGADHIESLAIFEYGGHAEDAEIMGPLDNVEDVGDKSLSKGDVATFLAELRRDGARS